METKTKGTKNWSVALCALISLAMLLPTTAADPGWWGTESVKSGTASDFSPANIGQLKNLTAAARNHLNSTLRGGAGSEIDELIDTSWVAKTHPDNKNALVLGQLKHISSLFYDRLIEEGYASHYPWTLHVEDDSNYSPANLGQLKNLFSFDAALDTDTDGLPDMWEEIQFGGVDRVDGTEDGDGDGLTTSEELALGLDPLDSDTDGDGFSDGDSRDLVGHFRFDENSGVAVSDSSPQGNHGAIIGTELTWHPFDGQVGGSIEFDGPQYIPNQFPRVSLPNTILDGAGDLTVAIWVRFEPGTHGLDQAILSGAGANQNEFILWYDTQNNRPHLDLYTGEGFENAYWMVEDVPPQDCFLFDGSWHHLAFVRNQTTNHGSLYIDGAQIGAPVYRAFNDLDIDPGGLIVGQEQDSVGGNFQTTQRFRGSMDDLRIYRRILTSTEIARFVDSDTDGLPDWWELQYFGTLTTTPTGDPDSDGQDNFAEFTGGLDPRWPGISDTHIEEGLPIITEVMASNKGFLEAPDEGENNSPDWIELHNAGTVAISLDDLQIREVFFENGLQDDETYTFPDGITIGPSEYVVVFCYGDNPPTGDGHYLPFKLPANAAPYDYTLQLLGAAAESSPMLQSITYTSVPSNETFGLARGGNQIGALEYPTPGMPNAKLVTESPSSPPVFGIGRGFYSSAQTVDLTVDVIGGEQGADPSSVAGVDVYVTTDGSLPGPESDTAFIYQDPLEIDATLGKTVVRAVTYQHGYRPSTVVTHSYLFQDTVVKADSTGVQVQPDGYSSDSGFSGIDLNYGVKVVDDGNDTEANAVRSDLVEAATVDFPEIPTISIATDQDNLFGPSGIYSNPLARGEEWERPASVEWLSPPDSGTPNGSHLFQIDCGIKIHGGSSRNPDVTLKHSFRLEFDDDYGAEELSADVFGYAAQTGGTNITTFGELLLRTPTHDSFAVDRRGAQDWAEGRETATYVKDAFAAALQRELGHLTPRRRWVHVYLNGIYWGIYEVMERPNKDFVSRHLNQDEDGVVTISGGEVIDSGGLVDSEPAGAPDGLDDRWTGAMDVSQKISLNSAAQSPFGSESLRWDGYRFDIDGEHDGAIDIDGLIDHIIINSLTGNRDWPGNNYWAYFDDTAEMFRFSVWDAEWSMRDTSVSELDRISQTGFLDDAAEAPNYAAAPGILYHYLRQYRAVHPTSPAEVWDDFNDKFLARVTELGLDEFDATGAGPFLDRSTVLGLYENEADNVERIINAEAARWGHVYQVTDPQGPPGSTRDAKITDWIANSSWVIGTWFGDQNDPNNPNHTNWRGDYLKTEFEALYQSGGNDPAPAGQVTITAYTMPLGTGSVAIPHPDDPNQLYAAGFWANTDSDGGGTSPDGADTDVDSNEDDLMKLELSADVAVRGDGTLDGNLYLLVPAGIRLFSSSAAGTVEHLDGLEDKLIVLADGENPAGHFLAPLLGNGGTDDMDIFIEGAVDGSDEFDSGYVSFAYTIDDNQTGQDEGYGGSDMVQLVPTEKDPCKVHFAGSLNEITGPKHRKIALNGLPLSDEKPQAEGESDQEPEESYIDALTLSLNHETTDVFIPLVAGELSLSVRRNIATDIIGDHQQLPVSLFRERAFGLGWRSGLSPSIRFVRQVVHVDPYTPPTACPADGPDPDYAYVTDENGSVHRFIIVYDATNSGAPHFIPIPSNRTEQESWLMTLTYDNNADEYTFTRKFGTELIFDGSTRSTITETIPEVNPPPADHTIQEYARLTKAEDRVQNRLLYKYPDLVSLIPSQIYAVTDAGLTDNTVLGKDDLHGPGFRSVKITVDGGCVQTVTDPRGNVTTYHYLPATTPAGAGLGQKLLQKVERPDGTFVHYGYERLLEIDDTPAETPPNPPNFFYHHNVNSITDANGNATTVHYARDRSRLNFNEWAPAPGFFAPPGQPRIVSSVERPLGGAQFNYDPYDAVKIVYGDGDTPELESTLSPDVRRITHVRDATGHIRSYTFGSPEVIDSSEFEDYFGVGGSYRRADLLIRWKKLTLTHPVKSPTDPTKQATEVFEFDPLAGMAVEKVTDFSGNVTEYTYGDSWDVADSIPFLDGLQGGTLADLSEHPLFSTHYSDPTKEQRDPDGLDLTKDFSYLDDADKPGNRIMESVIDPRGHESSYEVDPDTGLRLSEELREGAGGGSSVLLKTVFAYADPRFPGFITKKTVTDNEDPIDTRTHPDPFGNLAEEMVGDNTLGIRTLHRYDPNGNRISTTDPEGNTTAFKYDSRNRITKIIHPATAQDGGQVVATQIGYDARGNKIRETDPNGNTTFYFYDGLNRLTDAVRDMGSFAEDDPPTENLIETLPDGVADLTRAGTDLVTSYTYNLAGAQLEATDPNGNVSLAGYDAMQRPVWMEDALGNRSELSYDGPNPGGTVFDVSGFQPTRISDPRDFEVICTYDKAYRKVAEAKQWEVGQEEADYAKTTTVYDASSNPVLVNDPKNNQTVTKFDALDRAVRLAVGVTGEDPANFTEWTDAQFDNHAWTVEKEFTPTGLVKNLIDENGNETETEYDSAARLVRVHSPTTWVVPDGAGAPVRARPVTETVYDKNSRVVKAISPRGLETESVYDERNRLVEVKGESVWDAENGISTRPVSKTTYDLAGNVLAVTDPRGAVTNTVYDHAYRSIRTISPTVDVTTNTATGATTAEKLISRVGYDVNGNALTATDAEGNITRNTYDALDRLISTRTNPDEETGTDSAEKATDIVVVNHYDEVGNLLQVRDGAGQFTRFEYDGFSRVTRKIFDPASVHDDHGDPSSMSTQQKFGQPGVAVTDAENQETISEYDALTMTKRTDPMGRKTTYHYNPRYWLTDTRYIDETFPHGSGHNRRYTHDATGKVLTATYPNAADTSADASYVYDEHYRLIAETSSGVVHGYLYDADGNRRHALYGHTFDYGTWETAQTPVGTVTDRAIESSYDDHNRLDTMTESAAGSPSRTTTYSYDLNGNRHTLTLPNSVTTTSTHDALNRKVTCATPGVQTYAYSYDRNSDIVRIDEDYDAASSLTDRVVQNSYDGVRRLTQEIAGGTTTNYGYDKANNRTSKQAGGVTTSFIYAHHLDPAEPNRLNQLTRQEVAGVATVTYTYDLAGNRLTRKVGAAAADEYEYDFENRLVEFREMGMPLEEHRYTYDHRTRRVLRDEPDPGGGALGRDTTALSFSGGTSVQELDADNGNAREATFVRGSDYGGGVGGMLYSVRGTEPSYAHSSHRGDITAKTDGNGAIDWQAAYEAYGTRTQEEALAGFTNEDRQRGNTKDEDPTGLLNEGFRYRDLEAGVFITRDPAGFIDGPNLYTYVTQSPWTNFDPFGLEKKKGVFGSVIGWGADATGWVAQGGPLKGTVVGKIAVTVNSYHPVHGRLLGAASGASQTLHLAEERIEEGEWVAPALLKARTESIVENNVPIWSSGKKAVTGETKDLEGEKVELSGVQRVKHGTHATTEAVALLMMRPRGGKPSSPSSSSSNTRGKQAGGASSSGKTTIPLGEDLSSAAGQTVWRNVPEGHPGLPNAQHGICKPNGVTDKSPLDVRAQSHDAGYTKGSGLTSWTVDKSWAMDRQARLGGVVVETTAPSGSFWYNQAAKGVEAQVLIQGEVKGQPISKTGEK